MNKQEIELVKYRDFSDVFNGSFAFMSQELRQLIRVFGLYAGVPVIISVILSALYMQDAFATIFETINNGVQSGPNPVLILLTIIVSFVAQVFIMGLVPAYLGEYEDKGRNGFTAADVWNRFARHFGAIIGYSIITGLLMFVGFIFLIIPGIYLMVPFTFVLYVKVIEDKDLGDTLSRCFQLVKNRWWATFGIIILAYLIISVVGWLFSIPTLIVAGIQGFTAVSGGEAVDGSSLGIILSTVFAGLGQYILYPVLYVIIAFQYYTLREQKDRSSLMDRISSITEEE
ncbi:hypothetical protein [Marinilabilia salmonicolor]|uniref:hypothetical protein n=1 Tax=Marinilabilia salmonicolor TaxID=989 RepID=UPI00029A17BC|nr:hypothetical protein [Marinilabilia salmonicolor]